MGLFTRKKPVVTPPAASVMIERGADDQRRLYELLLRFEESQGGPPASRDGRARAAILTIARAGSPAGSPVHADSNEEFARQVMHAQHRGQWDGDQAWRWIAAVTERAKEDGDDRLVAHAALFTYFMTTVVAPQQTYADYLDMRLEAPAEVLRARIYTVALQVLPQLDLDSFLVRHDDENAMQIRSVLMGCAMDALKIAEHLAYDTAAVARRVLG